MSWIERQICAHLPYLGWSFGTDACTSSWWWMQNYSILLLAKAAKMVANGSKKMNFKSNYKPNEIAIKLRTNSEWKSKQCRGREKNIKANEIEQESKSRSHCKMTIIRCFHSLFLGYIPTIRSRASHICCAYIFVSRRLRQAFMICSFSFLFVCYCGLMYVRCIH